jgi:hypothetical protein
MKAHTGSCVPAVPSIHVVPPATHLTTRCSSCSRVASSLISRITLGGGVGNTSNASGAAHREHILRMTPGQHHTMQMMRHADYQVCEAHLLLQLLVLLEQAVHVSAQQVLRPVPKPGVGGKIAAPFGHPYRQVQGHPFEEYAHIIGCVLTHLTFVFLHRG